MKTKLILIVLFIGCCTFAQSNEEIAKVYIRKCQDQFEDSELDAAFRYFDKAMKYTDTIRQAKVAKLGALIHHRLNDLEKAKYYAKQYFDLEEDKSTQTYIDFLEFYVDLEEDLEAFRQKKEAERLALIAEEAHQKKLDSLTADWKFKSDKLKLIADSVFQFDKNKHAICKVNDYYGIINDQGGFLIKADKYKAARAYGGYILLMDEAERPSEIYCFESATKIGTDLPHPSVFNPNATFYNHISPMRADGKIALYPNNSPMVAVYDLKMLKKINLPNKKALFKRLKKEDKIERYDEDTNKWRINKQWYYFGGTLGNNVYMIFREDFRPYGYMFSSGEIIAFESTGYLSSFWGNTAMAEKKNVVKWFSTQGAETKAPTDAVSKYLGKSRFEKLNDGSYRIYQTLNGKEMIVYDGKSIEKLEDFLEKYNQ